MLHASEILHSIAPSATAAMAGKIGLVVVPATERESSSNSSKVSVSFEKTLTPTTPQPSSSSSESSSASSSSTTPSSSPSSSLSSEDNIFPSPKNGFQKPSALQVNSPSNRATVTSKSGTATSFAASSPSSPAKNQQIPSSRRDHNSPPTPVPSIASVNAKTARFFTATNVKTNNSVIKKSASSSPSSSSCSSSSSSSIRRQDTPKISSKMVNSFQQEEDDDDEEDEEDDEGDEEEEDDFEEENEEEEEAEADDGFFDDEDRDDDYIRGYISSSSSSSSIKKKNSNSRNGNNSTNNAEQDVFWYAKEDSKHVEKIVDHYFKKLKLDQKNPDCVSRAVPFVGKIKRSKLLVTKKTTQFKTLDEVSVYNKDKVPKGKRMPIMKKAVFITTWDIDGIPETSTRLKTKHMRDRMQTQIDPNSKPTFLYCLPVGMFDDDEFKYFSLGDIELRDVGYADAHSYCILKSLPDEALDSSNFIQDQSPNDSSSDSSSSSSSSTSTSSSFSSQFYISSSEKHSDFFPNSNQNLILPSSTNSLSSVPSSAPSSRSSSRCSYRSQDEDDQYLFDDDEFDDDEEDANENEIIAQLGFCCSQPQSIFDESEFSNILGFSGSFEFCPSESDDFGDFVDDEEEDDDDEENDDDEEENQQQQEQQEEEDEEDEDNDDFSQNFFPTTDLARILCFKTLPEILCASYHQKLKIAKEMKYLEMKKNKDGFNNNNNHQRNKNNN